MRRVERPLRDVDGRRFGESRLAEIAIFTGDHEAAARDAARRSAGGIASRLDALDAALAEAAKDAATTES